MLLQDFLFRNKFTDISEEEYFVALETVKTMFSGIDQLWSLRTIPEDVRQAKRKLVYSWLLAWQLMQLYPSKAVGISGMGSMPLTSKSIHDITIRYRDLVQQEGTGLLESLTTNYFGQQALQMIQTAPEMFLLQA